MQKNSDLADIRSKLGLPSLKPGVPITDDTFVTEAQSIVYKYSPAREHALTLTALVGLIAAEGVLGYFFVDNRPSLNSLISYALVAILPLALICVPLYCSYSGAAVFSAWGCIVVGALIQYGFYTSRGPSKILILGISIAAYWLLCIAALSTGKDERKRS